MTYILCMQWGPQDGAEVEWEDPPKLFKFPPSGTPGYLTQWNMFPMLPSEVYKRDDSRTCSCPNVRHVAYEYVGRDNGEGLIA
jgi:hypothetical protein